MGSATRPLLLVAALAAAVALWLAIAPPQAWLDWRKQVDPTPEVGERLVEQYGCRRCHRIAGAGGALAPDLAGITRRVDDPARVSLRLWLRDPQAIKPDTTMPDFDLSSSEVSAILAYLETVDRGAAGGAGASGPRAGEEAP